MGHDTVSPQESPCSTHRYQYYRRHVSCSPQATRYRARSARMFSAIPLPCVNIHTSVFYFISQLDAISQICSDGDVVCSSCSPAFNTCPVDACSAPVHPRSHREVNITLRTKVGRLLIRCAGAPLGCSWKGHLRDEPGHTKEVCSIPGS
jgi:hypothetical protein